MAKEVHYLVNVRPRNNSTRKLRSSGAKAIEFEVKQTNPLSPKEKKYKIYVKMESYKTKPNNEPGRILNKGDHVILSGNMSKPMNAT